MEKKEIQIIAEVGSVHDGSFGNANMLIELASNCGADSVKFQTHIPSAETLKDAPMPRFFTGEPRFDYFERTGFTNTQWQQLAQKCKDENIEFLSSPFSNEAVKILEEIGIQKYKIPSGEVTNLPLLNLISKTGKPVLLSSGMSNWDELDDAVEIFQKSNSDLTILQCTSEYPCSNKNVGLNVMVDIKNRYKTRVGYSDHTLTNYSAFAAVSLGASVIEKHLTFSKKMYGSDAKHSSEPNEFIDLVSGVKIINEIMSYEVNKDEIADKLIEMKNTFEKSIVSIVDIPKGTILKKNMLGYKKPGTGIPTKNITDIIGKRSKKDIFKDMLIKLEDLIDA
tara:strand:- start:15 stop:1025 length:1011 start_codon:yes stop_codon:yes gene_type:complete